MSHRVFISYAHQDADVAETVCATLERGGVACWMAPRDLLPGVPWAEALIEAIDAATVLLLVFSSSSNDSPQVLREVQRAVGLNTPILPLRIEDVPPSPSMQYFITTHHWLDAYRRPFEQHLPRLLETVTELLRRLGREATDRRSTERGARAAAATDGGRRELTVAVAAPVAKQARPAGRAASRGKPATTARQTAKSKPLRLHWPRARLITCAFAPDGKWLLVGGRWPGDDHALRLCGLPGGEEVGRLTGHEGTVAASALSPDGKRAVSSADDGTLRLWDVPQRQELGRLRGRYTSVAFSPDARYVLAASTDGTAGLWQAASGQPVGWLEGHAGTVSAVAFAPDGRLAATGGKDADVRVWTVADRRCRARLPGHQPVLSGGVTAVAFAPDGATLLSAGRDGTVRLWDLATNAQRWATPDRGRGILCATFAPDGACAASGGEDGRIHLWSCADGAERARLDGHRGAVTALAFSPDGRLLLTAGDEGVALLRPVDG